jgi:hypothetical protein
MRLAVTAAVVTAMGAGLLALTPASATIQPAGDPKPGRLLIGDSVSGGAADALRARGFKVDWDTSRQFYELPSLLRSIRTSLPRNVVISLGTNGTIELAHCRAAVGLAGPKRTIFFVTNRVPRTWQDGNNRTLRRCVASFPSTRAVLIDWYADSGARSGWFYSDGYHLIPNTGGIGYATLIDTAVDRAAATLRLRGRLSTLPRAMS